VDPAPSVPSRGRDSRWLVLTIGAVLAVPFVVALVALHHPRWYPLLDWAQTEIRVRDVASSHPPLIGLAGRIGPFGALGGSHPGPISFYGLWPVWALLGGSSFGLLAGDVVFDFVCIGLALWIAYRRGGLGMALAIGLVLSVLTRAYGAFMLTSPWNPYMPVLWWFVFLLAAWSLLLDDFVMLPVAVLVGTFCMQTHISYLGLVGGLGAILVVIIGVKAYLRRGDADARRQLWKWGLIAIVLGAVLWAPPVLDQITHHPGNLTTIREHFSNPPDPPIGLHDGVSFVLTQLTPVRLFQRSPLVQDGAQRPAGGTRLPGILLILVWAGSVTVAAVRKYRSLLMLDVVLGIALVLGFISAARIFGDVWFYLLLWAWSLTVLMLFTTVWAAVLLGRDAIDADRASRATRAGLVALVGGIVVSTTVFAWQAHNVTVMSPRLNSEMAALMPPTIARMKVLKASGNPGPYFVSWLPEVQAIGAQGYALQNELLRHGFDARSDDVFRPGSTRYHVTTDPSRYSLQVHLATGPDIDNWRRDPAFEQVAYVNPRTPAQQAEFDQLHQQVVDALNAAGQSDLAGQVDNNLFMLALSKDVAPATRQLISRMLTIGFPVAVFVGPVRQPQGSA
jgi:hypothetical protein